MENKDSNRAGKRIKIRTNNETVYIKPEQVRHLTCDGYLSTVHCADGNNFTVVKTLKNFEAILSDHGFMRVHHNAIVNTAHIQKIMRNGQYSLGLANRKHVAVSRRKVKELKDFIG
jgi:two-component system, LytTR family, response regulator